MAECSAEKQPSISSDGAQIFPFKVLLSYLVVRIYIKRLSIITENKGIVSPDSSPQTPQQNVVVDRKKKHQQILKIICDLLISLSPQTFG